jgi:outer membrane protein assembly factor BamB
MKALLKLLLLLLISIPSLVVAKDWPTFRGSDRTAVVRDAELLASWGEDGPELLWTATGAGRGYASPAIADGFVFTLGDGPSTANDKDEYLLCFDAASGKQKWMTKTGPAWNSGKESWQGSRSTPTVDGDMVYVVTPYGKLIAANTSDGMIAWQRDLKEDFSGKKKDGWGYSESPLVDGELVLCTPGGEENTVVALNKATGELVWSCQRPDDVGAGHSSIVIAPVGDRKVYVQNTGGGPMGIDAENGDLLWEYDARPPTAYIPTPMIKGDYVLSVGGYGLGGALLKQVATSAGSVDVEEVYGYNSALDNKHGGLVLVGDYVYGGSGDRNIVFCAELMNGEVQWKERGAGSNSTSVIAVGDKLIVRFQNGIVALASYSPDGYEEISTFQSPGSGDSTKPSWAHPVYANGRLYLREGDFIHCYQIAK